MTLLGLNRGNLIECQKGSIENVTKSDRDLALPFVDRHLLPDLNFNGHCLIKNNISIPKKVINLYIYYTLGPQLRNLNTDFTLGNCLSGSVELIRMLI